MITDSGAVLVRGHLEPDDAGTIEMNYNPVDAKDLLVLRQGVLQACSLGWPTLVETRYISPTPRPSC